MIDLAQKVRDALMKEGAPVAPPPKNERIPKGAVMLGVLPAHLQHLHVLCDEIKQAQREEEHRRCVAILGKEEYDHEIVEYMVHCEVEDDPRFTGVREVGLLLATGVHFHFPMIAKGQFENLLYAIDDKWQVWGVVRKGPAPVNLPPTAIMVG